MSRRGRVKGALARTGIEGHPYPCNQKCYLLLPSLDELVRDRRSTDVVAAVLGEVLLALSADVFVKGAQTTRMITWHQDVNDWQLEPFDLLTAWVALTPATRDTADRFRIRYAAAAARQVAGPPISARLARGADIHGHFALETGPDTALSPAALRRHRIALEAHEATGFSTV